MPERRGALVVNGCMKSVNLFGLGASQKHIRSILCCCGMTSLLHTPYLSSRAMGMYREHRCSALGHNCRSLVMCLLPGKISIGHRVFLCLKNRDFTFSGTLRANVSWLRIPPLPLPSLPSSSLSEAELLLPSRLCLSFSFVTFLMSIFPGRGGHFYIPERVP